MQQLTQEEGERCARACEIVLAHTSNETFVEFPVLDAYSKWVTLSLDPCFWFPRLWEKLRENWHEVRLVLNESLRLDCLALCDALEDFARTGKSATRLTEKEGK